MILDTNAVSAILAAEPGISAVLGNSPRHHLPVVVIAEYQFGILGSRYQKPLAAGFKRLEAQSQIIPCDRATATQYAEVCHALKHLGRPIPQNDVWIAALARQHSLEVVSQDQHFDLVPGLRRLGW